MSGQEREQASKSTAQHSAEQKPRAPDGFVVWSGSLWLETCRSPEVSDGPTHVRVHRAWSGGLERWIDGKGIIDENCSGTRC